MLKMTPEKVDEYAKKSRRLSPEKDLASLKSQLAAATAEGLLWEVHAWIDAYLHGDKDLACSMKVLFQRIDDALKEQGGQ